MKISAGQFKAKCLRLMDQVKNLRQVIIITKHGKPVAKLVPYDDDAPAKAFGCMKESVQVYGNLDSADETWNAERE